jgi:hypothetical protein
MRGLSHSDRFAGNHATQNARIGIRATHTLRYTCSAKVPGHGLSKVRILVGLRKDQLPDAVPT